MLSPYLVLLKRLKLPHPEDNPIIMRTILLLAACLFVAAPAASQNADTVAAPEPRPSPLTLARVFIGDNYVKVHYSSPRMRDPETGEPRVIFGELVPFGELWRTGANEATEITFSSDVMFGGQHVPGGTYSLFTIPGVDDWTVILNSARGEEGASAYDESNDIARVQARVEHAIPLHEALTIAFEETSLGADLTLTWEKTQVRVPIMSH